jgi:diguanylate cyclase (GGDEF)-like protein
VLESVGQLVTSQSARLYVDEQRQTVEGQAHAGQHSSGSTFAHLHVRPAVTPEHMRRAGEEALARQALERGEEATARQALEREETVTEPLPDGSQDVAVPLRGGGQVFGALLLHVAEPLSQADIRLVEQLTAIAGVALQNAYLYQETQLLATTDPLTGLSNYRAFVRALDLEVQRAQRMGHWVGLLMLDMDHFKDVNDRFGHPVGDKVLRQVAEVLRQQLRRIDVVGRLGGEEFAVLLPGATLENVSIVGEKLRKAVESLPSLSVGLDRRQLTLSVGGAALPPEAAEAQLLVNCADRALYRAKHGGRNQVQLWADEPDGADSGTAESPFVRFGSNAELRYSQPPYKEPAMTQSSRLSP